MFHLSNLVMQLDEPCGGIFASNGDQTVFYNVAEGGLYTEKELVIGWGRGKKERKGHVGVCVKE